MCGGMRRENGELFDRAMEFLHANELPPERTKEYDSMRQGSYSFPA